MKLSPIYSARSCWSSMKITLCSELFWAIGTIRSKRLLNSHPICSARSWWNFMAILLSKRSTQSKRLLNSSLICSTLRWQYFMKISERSKQSKGVLNSSLICSTRNWWSCLTIGNHSRQSRWLLNLYLIDESWWKLVSNYWINLQFAMWGVDKAQWKWVSKVSSCWAHPQLMKLHEKYSCWICP